MVAHPNCCSAWKTGLLQCLAGQLDELLAAAGGQRGWQELEAQLSLAETANELCKAAAYVLVKAEAGCWSREALRLRLGSKVLRLLGCVSTMLESGAGEGGGRMGAGPWGAGWMVDAARTKLTVQCAS